MLKSGRWVGGIGAAALLVAGLGWPATTGVRAQSGAASQRQPAGSLRLYVFDCGTLEGADVKRFGLQPNEVATAKMSVGCYLIDHPKGRLMWDVGAVVDSAWTPTGQPVPHRVVLADKQERTVTVRKTLGAQLAEAGYSPRDVTHLALSHNHWDHTANANDFKHATWLVRQEEHDVMFPAASAGSALMLASTFDGLRGSKTVIIKTADHDVFGDGTVVTKLAPGHTPGHLVLYLKLAKTGPVVLSGDLYHYPEERTLGRLPIIEVNQEHTRRARVDLDAFLKKSGAQLWIQHDFLADAKLKKAPAHYE